MTTRWLVPTVLAAVALVLCACGIPIGGPEALPASQIPYNLEASTHPTAPQPTTTAPAGRDSSRRVEFSIYLLENGVLVPQRRTAARRAPQPALDALVLGPTMAEFDRGITSSLVLFPVPHLRVEGPTGHSGVAKVALDTATASLADPVSLYEALGQVVWTLTQFCDIQEVSFTYDGNPFPAFLPNGTAPSRPVSRVDYLEIAPAASPAATKPSCPASGP